MIDSDDQVHSQSELLLRNLRHYCARSSDPVEFQFRWRMLQLQHIESNAEVSTDGERRLAKSLRDRLHDERHTSILMMRGDHFIWNTSTDFVQRVITRLEHAYGA